MNPLTTLLATLTALVVTTAAGAADVDWTKVGQAILPILLPRGPRSAHGRSSIGSLPHSGRSLDSCSPTARTRKSFTGRYKDC
jgi:hypothetical protein